MIPLSFIWVFVVTMAIGLPIVFALSLAPIFGFLVADKAFFLQTLPQKLYIVINQFPLLAIPLFILAGEIMNSGGITQRIVNLANVMVGHFRAGLAQVNIVASMLFAGLSGSAVADTSALGSMLIPAMEREGYTRAYAAAVTGASSVIGPIIPPSIIMVIYAYIMNVSVGGLFLAGFIPGITCGLGLMIATKIIGERRNYPKREKRATLRERADAFKQGIFPLLTPVIIIGGILVGVFTPTEAGAAAVVYAFFISVFVIRDIKIKDYIPILQKTGIAASAILLAVGTAVVFGWISTLSGIPNKLSAFIFTLSDNKYVLLFLLNIFFLVVGMFLDAGPAILILGPIVAPLMYQLGVEPLHFAIIMCVNLTIGLATPPMGLILFVASSISRQPIESIVKNMLPYYIVHILIILAVTFIPALSLTIPRYFGMGI